MPLLQSQCDSCLPIANSGTCKVCKKTVESDLCLCIQCYANPHCCRKCGRDLSRFQKLKDEQRQLLARIKEIEEANVQKRAEIFKDHIELANLINESKPKTKK